MSVSRELARCSRWLTSAGSDTALYSESEMCSNFDSLNHMPKECP